MYTEAGIFYRPVIKLFVRRMAAEVFEHELYLAVFGFNVFKLNPQPCRYTGIPVVFLPGSQIYGGYGSYPV